MRSGIGFVMISIWWCAYIGGVYEEHNSTTQTRAGTYDTRNGEAHENSDNFKKHEQEPPRTIGSNESRQMEGGQPPLLEKENSRLMWKILVVLTMILIYLTCLKCCSMVEPQEIVIEL